MSFGIPVRNGLGIGLLPSTAVSTLRIGGRPALILNFIGTTSLDSRVTFTRTTTATVTGSNGAIQSSAINEPRFDYDPTTLTPKGLLIEEQRINLLLNSLIDGTSLSTQSVTVAAVAHTISFYGTGSITLTGASVATVTGTGVYPNRQTLTFTPIVGVLVCTVSGSVQYAQLEAGAFATSFIPTAGAAVTRGPDLATMTGTNVSSWFNPTQGTFVTSADVAVSGTNRVIVGGGVLGYLNYIRSVNTGAIFDAGSPIATANTVTTTAPFKLATKYGNSLMIACLNAGTVASGAYNSNFATLTSVALGNSNLSSLFINGHIRQITYYNTQLANATLQVLTA